MLLAIDTATRFASLALYDPTAGIVRAEHTWYSVDNHTVELVPNLERMLSGQRVKTEELDGLAVSLGPGSFMGLRIGLSVAKGLAVSFGLRLAGVPTLDAIERAHAGRGLPLWAIVQVGRGRIAAAFYPAGGPRPPKHAYQLTTFERLELPVSGPVLFAGEIDAPAAGQLYARWRERAIIMSPAANLRRAAYVAELGWERLTQGEADDLATLSPIYLHQPAISGS